MQCPWSGAERFAIDDVPQALRRGASFRADSADMFIEFDYAA